MSLFGSVFFGSNVFSQKPNEKNSARLMILFGAPVTRRQRDNRKQEGMEGLGGMTPMKSSTSEVKSSIFSQIALAIGLTNCRNG